MTAEKTPVTEEDVRKHIKSIIESGKPFEKTQIYDIVMEEVFCTFTKRELQSEFKQLSPAQRAELLEDAEYLSKSPLFNHMIARTKHIVHQKLYNESRDPFVFAVNKMGLWTLENLSAISYWYLRTAKQAKGKK